MQTKGLEPINIIFEASGILLLATAAYIMSAKERLSLDKLKEKTVACKVQGSHKENLSSVRKVNKNL